MICLRFAFSSSQSVVWRTSQPAPRHQAVRKTCSDTGFKPAAAAATTDRRPLLSVPAVFVTSYIPARRAIYYDYFLSRWSDIIG